VAPRPRIRTGAELIALGFGSGLAPWAPGTAGTLVGVLLYLPLARLGLAAYLLVTAGLFLVGVWACDSAARSIGSPDPPAIVWDEVVGYLVTMAGAEPSALHVAGGFLLFRALDILKPWPISKLDRDVPGGLGIMLDDLLAGVAAALVLQLLAQTAGHA
jgi:phosphatidylglycerophosphatase A